MTPSKLINSVLLILACWSMLMCSPKQETGSPSSSGNTTKVKKTTTLVDGMVLIPAGTYTMGGKSDQADRDEFPRHDVSISSFYMDETEVTNVQFATFVKATGYTTTAEKDIDWEEMQKQLPLGTPKPADSLLAAGSLVFKATDGPVDLRNYAQWWTWVRGANWKNPTGKASNTAALESHPVVQISWDDAKAYCEWRGGRLPTEAEWEWAAMGGVDDSKYPWGDGNVENAYDKANFWQGQFPYENQEKDGFYTTAPVKSYPPNGYGLYDMAGNVWEWCQDKYHVEGYQMEETKNNPSGPSRSFDPQEPYAEKFVIRGGSFLCNDSYCSGYRVARRMRNTRDSGLNHTGCRCVKEVSE